METYKLNFNTDENHLSGTRNINWPEPRTCEPVSIIQNEQLFYGERDGRGRLEGRESNFDGGADAGRSMVHTRPISEQLSGHVKTN